MATEQVELACVHSRPSSPTRIRAGTHLLLFRAARLCASLARRSLCRVRSRWPHPVLLRKRKNLTARPPAGRARSLRPRRRSGADGRTSLQSFSARGRLGSRKQWRAPIFPRSTPCLPVVPCKAISILSKNPKKTRVAGRPPSSGPLCLYAFDITRL
jgi:hypothetical protein